MEAASPRKRVQGEQGSQRCRGTARLAAAQTLGSKGAPTACPLREVGGEFTTMGWGGEDGTVGGGMRKKEQVSLESRT